MLATHRKKPVEVTLIQLSELLEKQEESDVEVRRIDDETGYEIYNRLHDSWIKLELEDYINITTPGDYYPIKASIVDSTYEIIF